MVNQEKRSQKTKEENITTEKARNENYWHRKEKVKRQKRPKQHTDKNNANGKQSVVTENNTGKP